MRRLRRLVIGAALVAGLFVQQGYALGLVDCDTHTIEFDFTSNSSGQVTINGTTYARASQHGYYAWFSAPDTAQFFSPSYADASYIDCTIQRAHQGPQNLAIDSIIPPDALSDHISILVEMIAGGQGNPRVVLQGWERLSNLQGEPLASAPNSRNHNATFRIHFRYELSEEGLTSSQQRLTLTYKLID